MPNRLRDELSPYLLQHADNPVDWFPWAEEAFARAKAEDKPVFLSIGYSSCHWCHVMAHESFEDEEVASLMNKTFINVKVDREELPHIDAVYMQACQVLTGSGGWPLTIVMTPGKEPFFAATYLPKHSRGGLMGMMELIPVIATIWRDKRDRVVGEAAEIVRTIRRSAVVQPGPDLHPELLEKAYGELRPRFDARNGGFGTAPKFPMPQTLMFLLRHHHRTGDPEALSMALRTLKAMHAGGIYDHVGFGFHRYATDDAWLVPHFEKMLYDQALLAFAYTEAFQVTGNEDFRRVAEQTLTYALRDLRTPEGLFAASQDADSEGGEGGFYLWRIPEIRAALKGHDYDLAVQAFGLDENGNASPGLPEGLNIIHLAKDASQLAEHFAQDSTTIAARLEHILNSLKDARSRRTPPMTDIKALTDWNGLMIAALAKAGAALSRPGYIQAARHAADFILSTMARENSLCHVYLNGQARHAASLDDYAFLIWGLIELYGACFEGRYLTEALRLSRDMVANFWDSADGGFFGASHDADVPIARTKTGYDNAMPSGNSVAMLDLLRLAGLTGEPSYEDLARRVGRAFSTQAQRLPTAFTFLLCGLGHLTGPARQVVIAGDPVGSDTRAMIEALQRRFLPHTVVSAPAQAAQEASHPPVQGKPPLGGRATAYVCTDSSCREPTTEMEKMLEYLAEKP